MNTAAKSLFAILLFAVVQAFVNAEDGYSIVAVRDVEEWLKGTYTPRNVSCCNVCPDPKLHIIEHWTTKQININIPVPVLKPHRTQTEKECPKGYVKIAPNKCYREVKVTDRQPCAEGYSRISDDKCIKLILIETTVTIDETLVVCPPGFKLRKIKGVFSCKKGKHIIIPPNPPVPPFHCPKGYIKQGHDTCIKIEKCPKGRGWMRLPDGTCVKKIFICPEGFKKLGNSRCINIKTDCPKGYHESKDKKTCIKDPHPHPPFHCKKGYIFVNGKCVNDRCSRVRCKSQVCEAGYSLQKSVPSDCCGVCQPCACSAVIKPVCGVDGVTFVNECAAKCMKIEIKHQGECNHKDIPHSFFTKKCSKCSKCSDEHKPVCSAEGVTYQNKCVAKCDNANIIGYGKCEDVCVEEVDSVEKQFRKWVNRNGAPKDIKDLISKVRTSPELSRLATYVKVATK